MMWMADTIHRLVDLAGDEAGKEPAANTSYTLEDLYTLHNSGVADQLREWAESSQSISGEEFQGTLRRKYLLNTEIII